MVQSQALAKTLQQAMLNIANELDKTIIDNQKFFNEKELEEYKKAVGVIMMSIFDEVLSPLHKRHPEIKPKDLF
ncbi:hypothetical protein [Pantoea piersonii]|uniref:hypothetical protein n=1 Tax=Pantoea piersonii TaxID=2364647 RepID=UPI0022F1A421|nr:hypothetical protein [Pantoea piersonii]WBV20653.1 hypothetical protein PG877_13705 [Pantoea piersonii]